MRFNRNILFAMIPLGLISCMNPVHDKTQGGKEDELIRANNIRKIAEFKTTFLSGVQQKEQVVYTLVYNRDEATH